MIEIHGQVKEYAESILEEYRLRSGATARIPPRPNITMGEKRPLQRGKIQPPETRHLYRLEGVPELKWRSRRIAKIH